jgi:pilus assembly protein Flp/PilA
MFVAFFHDDEGATAIEYGLIAALIAVVILSALIAVGFSLSQSLILVEQGVINSDARAKGALGP